MPLKPERVKLWGLHLPPRIPRASDVNTVALATSYSLSGGQIKIIVQTGTMLPSTLPWFCISHQLGL
jgi:hypothetical protein